MGSNDFGSVRVVEPSRSGECPTLDEDDELTGVFSREDLPLHAPEDPTMIRLVVGDLAIERPIPLTTRAKPRRVPPPPILTDESCPGVSICEEEKPEPVTERAPDSETDRATLDPPLPLVIATPAVTVPVAMPTPIAPPARVVAPSLPPVAATLPPPPFTSAPPRARTTVFAILAAAAAIVGLAGGKWMAGQRELAASVPYATAHLGSVPALVLSDVESATDSIESLPSVPTIETTVVGAIGFAMVKPVAAAVEPTPVPAVAAEAEIPELLDPTTKPSKPGPSLEVFDDEQPAILPPFDASAASSSIAAASVTSCATEDGPTGVAHVAVTFASSGRVTLAAVEGAPFAGTAVGGCIAGKLRSASVPAFSGPAVTIRRTFAID